MLGVHSSQIKIVAVYQGSNGGRRLLSDSDDGVTVDFEVIILPVITDDGTVVSEEEMAQILNYMKQNIETILSPTTTQDQLGLNAAVLDVATSEFTVMERRRHLVDSVA